MNYLVDFTPESTQADIDNYLTAYGLIVVSHFDKLDKVYLVSGNALPPKTEIIEFVVDDSTNSIQLLDTTVTVDMEPVRQTSINIDEDKEWWKVASFNQVDYGSQTQQFHIRGKKSTVYLLDSGVDISHPEFVGSNVSNLFSFTGDFTDTRGHGTALASLIVGQTCGITGASLKSVKIFDTNQPTYLSDMLAAFNAVINDFIDNGMKPSFVNLSWNIAKNEYVEDKINTLLNYGLAVIAAAGNNGLPIENVTPASMERVLTVGAYNQSLTPCNFSNYTGGSIISVTGDSVNYGALDGWAPGEQIWAAGLGNTYGYIAGTSASAAITTAVFVYNYDAYIDANGQILEDFAPSSKMATKVFRRTNILTLTPPYENSINNICTVSIEYDKTLSDTLNPNNEVTLVINYGTAFKARLFDIYKYNAITHSQLPDGLQIANGFIYGAINKATPENSQQFVVNATVSGPDVSPANFIITITAYENYELLKENKTPISSVDPQLDISLANDAFCYWDGFGCASTGGCYTYCTSFFSAYGYCSGIKTAGCGCRCD